MTIKRITPNGAEIKHMEAEIERFQQKIVSALTYVGESCVREARMNGSYRNITGNLRGSIGYAVLRDGRIVSRVDSNEYARNFLNELAGGAPPGIVLIVCAGMEYALHVEARGKNVLTSAEMLAAQLVPQIMKQLGFVTR
jgi:hypothetical protein